MAPSDDQAGARASETEGSAPPGALGGPTVAEGVVRRALRPVRARLHPAAARITASLAVPTFATRTELVDSDRSLRSALAEVERVLADDLDATTEATALLGRSLAEVQTTVDAILELLRQQGGAPVTAAGTVAEPR